MPDSKIPTPARPAPPRAARRPHRFTVHGVEIEDPYAWLRDPGYPEVTDPEILAGGSPTTAAGIRRSSWPPVT